jgi:hypothetical protein
MPPFDVTGMQKCRLSREGIDKSAVYVVYLSITEKHGGIKWKNTVSAWSQSQGN